MHMHGLRYWIKIVQQKERYLSNIWLFGWVQHTEISTVAGIMKKVILGEYGSARKIYKLK